MFFKLLLSSILLIGALGQSQATVYVSEHIENDTRWTKANSPYILVNDIIVRQAATLEIEPGTKVLFSTETQMIVEGTIRAIGTRGKKILFEGKEGTRWNGFILARTCQGYDNDSKMGCVFQYCTFKGTGESPAQLIRSKGCNLLVANCIIDNCYTAIQTERQAHITVDACKFTNCNRPLNVRNTSIATITNNKMETCNSIMLGGTTKFTGNTLKNFTGKGRHSGVIIWMLGGGVVELEKNKFIKFEDYAIKLQKMSRRSTIVLRDNFFKNNGTNLKLSCKYVNNGTTIIEGNTFNNFRDYHVLLFSPCTESDEQVVEIGENHWGKLSIEEVQKATLDHNRDEKIGAKVLFKTPQPKQK